MGLRRFVFRSDRRCIFQYCISRDSRSNDGLYVNLVCSRHSVLYLLEEKNKTGYAGAEIDFLDPYYLTRSVPNDSGQPVKKQIRQLFQSQFHNINAVVKCVAFFQAGPLLQWCGTIW